MEGENVKAIKSGLIKISSFLALILWLVELPALVTTYGRENHLSAFPLDVPWAETYMVLCLVWLVFNLFVGLIFMVFYTIFTDPRYLLTLPLSYSLIPRL